MRLPEGFTSRMNVFFDRAGITGAGFEESFDKEPLKGIRINRSKVPEEKYQDIISGPFRRSCCLV